MQLGLRYLMDKYNIPLDRVAQHNHWSGKNCPRIIRKEGWDKFLALIPPSPSKSPPKPPINPYPGFFKPGVYIRMGSTGKIVKELQAKLGRIVVDGTFGVKTMGAVESFQKAHGLKVDSIVGPQTWGALFN